MKVIGTSPSGNPIVELEQKTRETFATASAVLFKLANVVGLAKDANGGTLPHIQIKTPAPTKIKRHYTKRAAQVAAPVSKSRDKV